MNVDQPTLVTGHERAAQDSHEPGEHDQPRRPGVDRGGERGLERGSIATQVIDHDARNACVLGVGQRADIGIVADDARDREVLALGVDQRFEIGASARDQDDYRNRTH